MSSKKRNNFKGNTNNGSVCNTKNYLERQEHLAEESDCVGCIVLLKLFVRLLILDINVRMTAKESSIRNNMLQNHPRYLTIYIASEMIV